MVEKMRRLTSWRVSYFPNRSKRYASSGPPFPSYASCLRIPMMSISHSDLMPIRSERSDAGLSQFEIVIGISQYF
jgi:hypothetical protein